MASNIALKGWNIVAGKPPRRGPSFNPYKARTRPQQNQQNPKAKAPVKRARVSTASTTSTISTDEIRSPSRSIMTLTLETFKSLNTDEKLDNIFLYLQNIREVSERLDVTESHVRELRDRVDDNIEMTTLLSYKSIDAEARQRQLAKIVLAQLKSFFLTNSVWTPIQFAYNVRTVWVVQEDLLKELSNTDR